jgi:hypothetical protein
MRVKRKRPTLPVEALEKIATESGIGIGHTLFVSLNISTSTSVPEPNDVFHLNPNGVCY